MWGALGVLLTLLVMDVFGEDPLGDPLNAAEELLANFLPQGVMQHVMDLVQQ